MLSADNGQESPPTAAVTGISFCPTPSMAEPTPCSFSPAAPIFCNATKDCSAYRSRSRRACSVSAISLCRASYWLLEISPFASASLACCPASFKASSFSFVSLTAWDKASASAPSAPHCRGPTSTACSRPLGVPVYPGSPYSPLKAPWRAS